ncbi:MAG TPA: hypothetical protein VL096_11520 [Pirellulaceae bacterium]|nr:hypothetical protein [Pirellulaceae bacterium]
MAFQFQCPQGHLLEGDESQAGQTCQCPMCGMAFIIPAPLYAPTGPYAQPEATPEPQPMFPGVGTGGPVVTPEEERPPALLHIPCPNGHELETPLDMLDQDVMCPHCGVQFRLREKDSVEFKKKRQLEDERRLERSSKLWFTWAIVIAVGVLIFLITLIALQAGR